MKIERNAFSKYVLDLLVEQFAHYCEARFSFFKITTPPNIGLLLMGVESCHLSNCNALSTRLSTLVFLLTLNTLWDGD